MSISYVGGQVGSFAGTTSAQTITFALTNGSASVPAANDLVIVSYGVGSGSDRALTIQNTGATDYTLMGTELFQTDTFACNLRVAYRFMPATPETQVVLSGTGAAQDAGAYTIHVYRDVDAGTPMDVTVTTAIAPDTRLANPPSILPTTTGAWIHIVGAAACGTGGTFTAAYLTDLRVTTQVDNNDVNIASGYVTWSSGTYDPAAFGGGGTDTTSDSWCALTAALRPSGGQTYTKTVNESLAMSDQQYTSRLRTKHLSETSAITLYDGGVSKVIEVRASQSLTGTVVDSQSLFRYRGPVLGDAVTVTDQAQQFRMRFKQIDEAISLTDAALVQRERGRFLADALGSLTDGQFQSRERGRVQQDTLTIADSTHQSRERGRVASDSVVLTDALLRARYFGRTLSDTITVSDELIKVVVLGNIVTVLLSDGVTVVDSLILSRTRNKTLGEALAVADTASWSREVHKHVLDLLVIVDQVILSRERGRVLQDQANVSDSATATFISGALPFIPATTVLIVRRLAA